MASAITKFSSESLDPHFYAYGQFPLYLVYFSFRLINFWFSPMSGSTVSFYQSIMGLRILSAILSCFSVYYLYLISKYFFIKSRYQLIFLLFVIFNPGLIQIAHFGTTESLLVFVFVFNIYYALNIYSNKKINLHTLILISLINGFGMASKISSLALMTPIFLALIIKKHFLYTTYYIILTTILACILSPYSFIALKDFISTMNYETSVATGTAKVFYTNQFLHTIPYWFQFKNIFPYVSGLPVFILSFFGLITLFFKKNFNLKFFIVLIPSLIYFLYFGQLYTKWTRFVSPLFFVFPFLAAYFISKIKSLNWILILGALGIMPGVLFVNTYLHPDIRLLASKWMDSNIQNNSIIFSEAGNVINIPLDTKKSFDVINFDFFSLDEKPENQENLYGRVRHSDYVLVPSRRVFKNQFGLKFPYSDKYYKDLFGGNLGFSLTKTFQIPNYFLLDPENAEETWTVFDQPKIRFYSKL